MQLEQILDSQRSLRPDPEKDECVYCILTIQTKMVMREDDNLSQLLFTNGSAVIADMRTFTDTLKYLSSICK